MYATKTALICALIGLSACSGGGGGSDAEGPAPGTPPTTPGPITVEAGSALHGFATSAEHKASYADADDTSGYSESLGPEVDAGGVDLLVAVFEDGDVIQFTASANMRPQTFLRAGPDSGFITYEGRYHVEEIIGLSSDTDIDTDVTTATGTLEFLADFTDGEVLIVGNTDLLTMEGVMDDTGTEFTGTVTWRGVEADVTGKIGSGSLIGGFAGDTDDTVFAGIVRGNAVPD